MSDDDIFVVGPEAGEGYGEPIGQIKGNRYERFNAPPESFRIERAPKELLDNPEAEKRASERCIQDAIDRGMDPEKAKKIYGPTKAEEWDQISRMSPGYRKIVRTARLHAEAKKKKDKK